MTMDKQDAQENGSAAEGQEEVSISRLEEEEKSVNPLVAGDDVEQNFVVLHRLYMDCHGAPAQRPTGVADIRDYVLAQLAEKQVLERKQIDLSYMPRGHREAAAAVSRRKGAAAGAAAAADACERLLLACCPGKPCRRFRPSPVTEENLKKELQYLQQWADMLHAYGVAPAVEALSPPPFVSSSSSFSPAAAASLLDREEGAGAAARQRQVEQRQGQPPAMRPAALTNLLQQQQRGRGGRRRGRTATAASLPLPLQPPPHLRPPLFRPPPAGAARVLQTAGWRAAAAAADAAEGPVPQQRGHTEDADKEKEEEEMRELLRVPSALQADAVLPHTYGVREVVEMFEARRGTASEQVKMLELDCRRLVQQVKQREAERDRALERLQQATREKVRMTKETRIKQKILQQREEALALTLEEQDCVRRVLERKLQKKEKAQQQQDEEITASKTSLAQLQSRLIQSEALLDSQEKGLEQLRSHLSEVQKEAETKETEHLEERKAYLEDRLKLERIHFQCECLGEDRLRLFEALRRDKATLDLRDAEIVLYRRHIEVLTEERNYYAQACEAMEMRTREEKAQVQHRFEEELSRRSEILREEKDRHAETAKTLAKAQQQYARQQQLLGRFKDIVQAQQAHLKSQATEFSKFMERMQAFKEKLSALEKLVDNLKTAYGARVEELARPTVPVPTAPAAPETILPAPPAEGAPGIPTAGPAAAAAGPLPIPKETLLEAFAQAAQGRPHLSVAAAVERARRLGLAPSEADVEALATRSGGEVTAEAFTQFCAASAHPEDAAENMARFFSLWDSSGSGMLSATQIRQLLQAFGEPLSDEDAQFAVTVIGEGKDVIDYRDFCRKLLAASAEQRQ